MTARRWLSPVAALLVAGCAEHPLLDVTHPAVAGQVGAVSRREVAHVLVLARQHLVESGRASHVIYRADIWSSDMIAIFHDVPPKRVGDCLESFTYKRVKGQWQLWGRESVCGHNIPFE